MRWWLFIALLCIPLAQAHTGWYYAGDSFELDGTIYSVEGTSHERVLFSAAGRSYILLLGECIKEGLSEYCYVQSAYPSDDDHIKYAAGNQYFGHYMSIESIKPEIVVTRTTSVKVPKLGEEIVVTVKVENNGDYAATQFVYTETVPAGMTLKSGPSGGPNNITFTKKVAVADEEFSFSYRLVPTDYVNAQMTPNVSFMYEGAPFTTKVSSLAFFVDTPLEVNRNMPATIGLAENAVYMLNITNKEKSEMRAQVTVRFPPGLRHTALKEFVAGPDGIYSADITLEPESSVPMSITFYSIADGAQRVQVEVVGTVEGTSFQRYYDEAVAIKADKMVPTVKLSSNRLTYAPGDTLTIQGVLENRNDGITFKTISGTLSAPGLFEQQEFRHTDFPPKRTLTEAEAAVIMPDVAAETVFNVTFAGRYVMPTGQILEFEAKKAIIVNPVTQAVAVTHTIDPATPAPGQNITVTITGKNTYGKYATFSAFDTVPFSSTGGLLYADTSLERDESRTLYTYRLAVPENFTEPNFNITTSITLKGEPNAAKTTVVVPIAGKPQPQEETPEDDVAADDAGDTVEKKELGFFGSAWDFLKGLFS